MRITVAVVALGLFAGPAWAVTPASPGTDEASVAEIDAEAELDALFASLQSVTDLRQGRAVEREILSLWLRSGDETVDDLMSRSIAAMSLGAYDLALTYLDQVVTMRPDFAEGWNKRATVYYLVNEYDKSIGDIQQTLAIEPRHFGALAGLGMIMVRIGDKPRAIAAFKQALAVNPTLTNIKAALTRLEDEISEDL
jgi:tetratricopeptide (TPR) repeat protein